MNPENDPILTLAGHLAGDDADETVLAAMCDAAAAEIEARLKDGVSPTDLGSTYVTAAGILALSMYCAVSDPHKLRGFRAGDVSVEYGDGGIDAEKLRVIAENMLAGRLQERGFGFRGVRG